MSRIEITRIEDVREGDAVRLEFPGRNDAWEVVVGPAYKSTPSDKDFWVGGYNLTADRFVSATREAPEWEPGTVGTAILRDVPYPGGKSNRLRVMRTRPHRGSCTWVDEFGASLLDTAVTDFEPDDAEALRRDVVKYKEAASKYLDEHAKECAEVERLRAARTVPTREQAVAAIERRLSWASIHWGVEHLHPDALPEIAGAVLGVVERGGTS